MQNQCTDQHRNNLPVHPVFRKNPAYPDRALRGPGKPHQ